MDIVNGLIFLVYLYLYCHQSQVCLTKISTLLLQGLDVKQGRVQDGPAEFYASLPPPPRVPNDHGPYTFCFGYSGGPSIHVKEAFGSSEYDETLI